MPQHLCYERRMQRTRQPCRQLNSEGIKSTALCYLTPVISGRCSIISAKCLCRVKDKALPKAWATVCGKRDVCDRIHNVAFFFSAIGSQEKKKGSINENTDEESSSEDEIPSSFSQQWLEGNLTNVNKSLCSAIAYWVALTTVNGAPASPISVHKTLLNSGLEVTATQFQEGKESPATAELYKVLKDHKNPFMQDLVSLSFKHCYQDEARKVIGDDGLCTQELDDCGTENVVRVTLVNPKFHTSLLSAVELLTAAELQLDKFGFESSTTTSQASTSQLSMTCDEDKMLSADKLAILVNDIPVAMGKLGYPSYRGKVYKKNDQARYKTRGEARAFVNTLATNEFFKARLLREMKRVIDQLSDPFCELFSPLIINYDLTEVKDGRCWSISRRDFVEDAIEEQQVGKISPREFCSFDSARDPDPKYFREVLENSLSTQEVAKFCDDFLKLLLYNKKQHKDKVPCLVGDANNGKTTLFMPILGLIHHGNVATVTKQKAFNKSMITPFTEGIFIDEATERTLDFDDWKILTQGGYAAHDMKYQSARAFINRCPMLITSQRKLAFGPADQPAMERRLRTYTFRSLPRQKKKASNWMGTHPMDYVLWAVQKAEGAEN
ncbi:unnamed protein product [Porites lobata]|uniref:SF3 helicase domain-containing protein n=1 Tax=Porites lobata TaxID=104759 RepID=A0ABN8PM21_9CNID|nr:unnamed protein product [Porites lobata]